jgi:ADP-heptose:LPS heptosyltransferase
MSGLLYAVPCLRALRQKFPNSEIILLANHFAAPIIQDCPYIDKIIPFYQFREDELWYHKVELFAQKALAFLNLFQRVDLVFHLRLLGIKRWSFAVCWGNPFKWGSHKENRIVFWT